MPRRRTLDSAPPPPPLTVAEIKDAFGSGWTRGERYWRQGRALIQCYDDGEVEAKVRGTAPRPYTTRVAWDYDGDWFLDSDCTCPIGGSCKHAVAVALAWLERLASSPDSAALAGADRTGQATTTMHGEPDVAAAMAARGATRLRAVKQPHQQRGVLPQLTPPPPSVRFNKTMLAPNPFLQLDARIDTERMAVMPRRQADVSADSSLRWLFWWGQGHDALLVCPVLCKRLKTGRWGAPRAIDLRDDARLGRLRDVPADRLPWLFALDPQQSQWHTTLAFYAARPEAAATITAIVESGEAHWLDPNARPLHLGTPRPLQLRWDVDAEGKQNLVASVEPGAVVVGDGWTWYVDPVAGLIGPADSTIAPAQRRVLARMPAIPAEYSSRALDELTARLPGLSLPSPRVLPLETSASVEPRGLLTLAVPQPMTVRGSPAFMQGCVVTVAFRYDGAQVAARDGSTVLRHRVGDRVRLMPRDFVYEQHVGRFLEVEGFKPPPIWPDRQRTFPHWRLHTPFLDRHALRDWLDGFVARATRQRIDVEAQPDFPVQIGADLGVTEVDLVEAEDGWFEARLGLIVDDQRIDLLPLVVATASDPERLMRDGLTVMLPDGRNAWLSPERLAPMIALLEEGEYDDGRLQLARPKLVAFDPPPDWRFTPDPRLAAFLDELRGFDRLTPIEPPAGFGATLRPYQQFGLAWLDFLRRYGFGGVLADDMGLGKTVQCLAHVARERAAGRLQQPVLVICPTSVVPNWLAEVERFVPELRVLALERGDRTAALRRLGKHDLVITSYALLPRDVEALTKTHWQMLVLDEAQWLKNKATKAWHAVSRLRAHMRLAMTGTPVENHLGELKAQLDLVMPGLLGDDRHYAERYRGPIERARDAEAEAALRKRIRPFLLRRRKDDVAIDLPPRTTLVRKIAFDEAQQDLYETLRARMEKRVRDALKKQGLARSHITVLDALLKLRQACCDPSLVDLPAARKVKASAKRTVLMEILPTLVDEGRHVLVFSQFTSMLDLIEADLRAAGMGHVRLDGSTRDRGTPVKRFQAGAAPVFLISLKAGGVGLNLTRADTVILYDPWWNPAVESQAIDRAHRIGQDKPVFVHELQCIGTVEEKMATLKARKRALADAVLAEGEAAVSRLDADSLLALFAPTDA